MPLTYLIAVLEFFDFFIYSLKHFRSRVQVTGVTPLENSLEQASGGRVNVAEMFVDGGFGGRQRRGPLERRDRFVGRAISGL